MKFDCPICGGVVVWDDEDKQWICRDALPKITASFNKFIRNILVVGKER